MENPFYNRLGSALWVVLIVLVVMLASYVSLGRLVTANLADYRVEILAALNERLPFGIDAREVSGQWQSFTPALVLTELQISIPGSDSPPLALSRGRLGLDVLDSLRTGSLQMTRLELEGLSLQGELSRDGVFKLKGFGGGAAETAQPLREFLLNVERISLRNNRLILTPPEGEVRDMALDLELSREGSQRHVQATLVSSAGATIAVVAQGLGDPFMPEAFSGQVYLDMQSTDLGAVKDLVIDQSIPAWADGTVDLEVWLSWREGEPSVEARIEGSDLLLAAKDASWHLPLQRVALEAGLQRQDNQWTLFVSNLHIENGGVAWFLPRLQLDTRDNATRLRTDGFSLEPINAILTDLDVVSQSLREVFQALHPRGDLSALQVDIDNISQPSVDWQVAANFNDLAVDSLRGAPGVTAVNGYARIGSQGGFVIIDSQTISLNFPAIFNNPLYFEDLYGTIHLDWDDDDVRLASGLLTTQGEEGTGKTLFSLNIPLQPDNIGIEMNLLVGLQDTHPTHRVKYVPYILNPGLRKWLEDSIGEGNIELGGFLWRGSLKKGAAPLRSVQLAFNVADTQLSYHPQWPSVLVDRGVILIDDSDVSVWAERASLYESTVERLSVETRVNAAGDITLDLQGSLTGPVNDGFKVLNESPLAQIVGPTFGAWTAGGQLETDLRLRMNLSDKSARPSVDVATVWRDVDLLIVPGNLPLQSVDGEFEYSTATGFNSDGLTAELWGNAVAASLSQKHSEASGGYDSATTVIDIDFATRVDLADVRRWLQLESLAFASGQTEAGLNIRLAPGIPPLLTVYSDLQGISLDLPQPWDKQAEAQRNLHLEIPLAQGVMPLSVELGEQLRLRLDLDSGVLHSGALGINQPAPHAPEGEFHVAGHAALLHADEWFALAQQYLGDLTPDGTLAEETNGQTAQQSSTDEEALALQSQREEVKSTPLKVTVDSLRADKLVVSSQELEDIVLNLTYEPSQWQLAVSTNWLRGELFSAREEAPMRLAIEHLDLDGLPDMQLSGNGSRAPWELPEMEVSLRNILQSGKRLGELDFALYSKANVLTVDSVTGELAKLRFRATQPGQLVWHQGEEGYTEVQGSLDFDDLGQSLEYFDYQRIVETESGSFDVWLRWPGGPQDFLLADGEGSLQVQIGQGSFLDAPAGATGAVRVASILNLADIVRRLSRANTFEAGIPFDSVKGEVDVRDGMLTVARMDVDGGSSFKFSGVTDLRTKTLDGQLVATLPVANNLPWIVALAASLPVAAGVFVVSQVFNKQMNRLSSAVYTIGGTWSDPEVTFDRIFDNTPNEPAEEPAESVTESLGVQDESFASPEASTSAALEAVVPGQSTSP